MKSDDHASISSSTAENFSPLLSTITLFIHHNCENEHDNSDNTTPRVTAKKFRTIDDDYNDNDNDNADDDQCFF
jgi:hypothetical protein